MSCRRGKDYIWTLDMPWGGGVTCSVATLHPFTMCTISRHKETLDALQRDLETQHEEQLALMKKDWKQKLDAASSDASSNMQALQSTASEQIARAKQAHATDVVQKEARHKQEVDDLLQRHEQQLEGARAGHEAALKALRGDLDRTVWEKDKELAAVKQHSSQELRTAQV